MRTPLIILSLVLILPLPKLGAESNSSELALRPVHTYSIVARDPDTGAMGVAVQSHWFNVGSLVAWAEAGVGAVATQSFVDVRYGASGLELMRTGWDAPQTLKALLLADHHPEVRQVGMIDKEGNVVAHTGDRCIQHAGHLVKDNFAVQANLMLSEGVPEAMAAAFEKAKGDLAHRMMVALEAAQALGGDLRGQQAAAVLVVSGENTGQPWKDRLVDLNVEDHPEPLKELRRLLALHDAYEHMDRGDLAIEENDMAKARAEYGAAQKMFPENLEMKFWYAVALVNAGEMEESLPIFKEVLNRDGHWAVLIPRLVDSGLLPSDSDAMKRIMSQVKP